MISGMQRPSDLIETLERRRVVTTNPTERDQCCGLPRDEDGFCTYKPQHPIYVAVPRYAVGVIFEI
jgi:hypothetical protein